MGANKSIEDIEATLLFRKRPLLCGGKGSTVASHDPGVIHLLDLARARALLGLSGEL
jgi:hypothetical protein